MRRGGEERGSKGGEEVEDESGWGGGWVRGGKESGEGVWQGDKNKEQKL